MQTKNRALELRWDPVLGEWIMVSSIREERPWRPKEFCPFCPGAPEMGYGWRVKIVENKFPMLVENPPPIEKHWFYKKAPSTGKCLVVVETPNHDLDDISDLSVDDIELVIREIKKAINSYKGKEWAKYFFWFRNKGDEIGVSLKHPHSQVYVLPFIPAKIERELVNSKKYFEGKRECLFCRIISVEKTDRVRLLFETSKWISFIPFYAHWPFEVHVYPKRHVQLLTELDEVETKELAIVLKKVLCGLKKVFEKPMPYMLTLHQAPLDGIYPYYHLHIEIYGVYRPSGKMKYAAGMETGGGNFTYDSTPEENAKRLRHILDMVCRE